MEVLMILLFLACLAVLYFKPQKEGLAFFLFWCATGLCFFMYMVGSINAILPNMTY